MTPARDQVTGVILAGGQSRRMFPGVARGGDKSLRELAGRPMLAHVIDRLRPQAGRLIINANGDPSRFDPFGLPVAPDTVDGFAGPLAGVLAGMRWSQANAGPATHIATASTDAPFIPSDLVARLTAGLEGSTNTIAMARSGGEVHPVIGLWPVNLADDLEHALRAGVRKVLAWTDMHGTQPVDFPFTTMAGCQIDPFFNANHPDELEEARRLLRG
jgi:molybdenum cofactor guanylyltransferase